MARKPVLEGGKKDEIIAAATALFFTEGYEGTSVRQIITAAGGEVGMFYHYFRSKEELFDTVVDRFFTGYAKELTKSMERADTPEKLADIVLCSFDEAMERYRRVEGSMHWSVSSALHERTLLSLIPAAEKLLERFGYAGGYPMDIAAAKVIAVLSAALHSVSFSEMEDDEKKELLIRLLEDCLR